MAFRSGTILLLVATIVGPSISNPISVRVRSMGKGPENLEFEPKPIWEKLVYTAEAHNISEGEFYDDIRTLISLSNSLRDNHGRNCEMPLKPPVSLKFFSSSFISKLGAEEGYVEFDVSLPANCSVCKNELEELEKKYEITKEPTNSKSVTTTRLGAMFPHLTFIDQKPYTGDDLLSLTDAFYAVNPIFGHPEFGGFIPKYSSLLRSEDEKMAIIGLHLYTMAVLICDKDVLSDEDLKLASIMLKRRMEKSVLSDEDRVEFLLKNELLVRESNKPAWITYDYRRHVPKEFKKRIDWKIFSENEIPTEISLEFGNFAESGEESYDLSYEYLKRFRPT